MSINIQFAVLLAQKSTKQKRRISIAEVSRETGISERTLQAWYKNEVTRFDTPVLEALCKFFTCQPGDLLTYEESQEIK